MTKLEFPVHFKLTWPTEIGILLKRIILTFVLAFLERRKLCGHLKISLSLAELQPFLIMNL